MQILFVSLGCDKNLVDTEMMLGQLAEKGYTFTDDEAEADIAVVNSCCFIGDAKEESINTILQLAELKTEGQLKALIVCGCLAQRYKDEIQTEIPEVDAIIGTTAIDRIVETVDSVLAGKSENHLEDIDRACVYGCAGEASGDHRRPLCLSERSRRAATSGAPTALFPHVRGPLPIVFPWSRLAGARQRSWRSSGAKELILVAQETTVYGIDLYGEKMLPELLRKLCTIEGLVWIRLLYCYPEEITEDLIQVMKEQPKVCHYLDMPIQHASDKILAEMGRKTRKEELEGIIAKLREEIPDICLRNTH